MTLHPIAVVDRVLEEYRGYLATEFRASDPDLRAELERALDQAGFLAQEPFFQAHRPFRIGRRWADLGLDPRLASVMARRSDSATAYHHQSEAIVRLLADDAGPLVVTTGTGSGKTEAFLLPVLHNAIADAVRFRRSGLTALLVYPMNALANDQKERIDELLRESGYTHLRVARYDRSTSEAERRELRERPPHVLLTNYMMLEYLLVRPADREALFANHRCRFLVLDEVHTYRGGLGANIALLVRRLLTHLRHATHTHEADDRGDRRRFPTVVPVATSATIKSVEETGRGPEEVRRLRDEAVQAFLQQLTGIEGRRFAVMGEELQPLHTPAEAAWPPEPVAIDPPDPRDPAATRHALRALASGADGDEAALARRAGALWTLADLLARKPMSLSQLAASVRATVPERATADPTAVERELRAALVVGAALDDGTPGALRLRTHRLVRGGWRFTRCVDPTCGRLYPKGEERCACGCATAPLYLCRACGADTLRFRAGDPTAAPLQPHEGAASDEEWLRYTRPVEAEDEDLVDLDRQQRGRPILRGSLDPRTCSFADDERLLPVRVVLSPSRGRCLVCGGTAGAHDVLTPVALGTSAAVRVLCEGLVDGLHEQHAGRSDHDGKERLLVFADSRQDAAHQARFISYAGRYDRMRRRLVRALATAPDGRLTIPEAVRALVTRGVELRDNPIAERYEEAEYLPPSVRERAEAWEEAPLLDDLAVSAGYKATVFHLGLVGVRYAHLERYVEERGHEVSNRLGLDQPSLTWVCRSLLDEMRHRRALSRPMLCYHPANPSLPDAFRSADWERRVAAPTGYACGPNGAPLAALDAAEVPDGITHLNAWRRPRAGGRGPSVERLLRRLSERLGGAGVDEDSMVALLGFLTRGPQLLLPTLLHGYRQARQLLQVNADAIELVRLDDGDRFACAVCHVRLPWAWPGAPCPSCRGKLQPWPEHEFANNRYVRRLGRSDVLPLVAAEHTAQVTGEERIALEEAFKAAPPAAAGANVQARQRSALNLLACSPTLEMGIDVGGLDAVVLRNVPPRPDNYAQRGGRAGRRKRVGIVVGYARATPHDGYFFDKPEEMIAGEVAAPGVPLGHRDVVLRHLRAIVLGGAEPGLAGQMAAYLTIQGDLIGERIEELITSLQARIPSAVTLAREAWGPEILEPAGLAHEGALEAALATYPDSVRELFDRVRRQILQLQETIDRWNEFGRGDRSAVHAQTLKRRLLGIPDEGGDRDADDRGSGHPMRRFAEFGLLPGYEFPSEPCTLRLWGDAHEHEPVTVARRFGIAQYQPDATAHARGHRWRVVGLDLASPWNPRTQEPDWIYVRCRRCDLRYGAQEHATCPRCGAEEPGRGDLPAHGYGGFLAVRSDTPVLQEEDRYAQAALVRCQPQRDGRVAARYTLPTGWQAELRHEETIRWLNEARAPTDQEQRDDHPLLHPGARGFYLCPACGRSLSMPQRQSRADGGRRRARRGQDRDPYGHATGCERAGQPPKPVAIVATTPATTLRLEVTLPFDLPDDSYQRWGLSLGYALRTGMRQLYMLDGPEIEFELEPSWPTSDGALPHRRGALTFVDAAVGGSGFLDQAAAQLHLVAARTLAHLDHPDCDGACYRCLKSYQNQRHHEHLAWPAIMPDLEQLAATAPERLALKRGDRGDPGPWLEAYGAGVGSPLELAFLRLFERHALSVEKQVAVGADEGTAPISQADFRVTGSRVLIYVDGAAFHRGQRLRRDRWIRERLRRGGAKWTVVEVGAPDLQKGADLVRAIREAAGRH